MVIWVMKYDDAAVTFFQGSFNALQGVIRENKRLFFPCFQDKVYMYYERGYDEYIYIAKLGQIIDSFRDWRMYKKI